MKNTKRILAAVLTCLMLLSIGSLSVFAANEYIGEEKAKEAALTHAHITAADAKFLICVFDYENGLAVYDVEFYYDTFEYSYDINAKTGEVVKYEKDYLGSAIPDGEFIGEKAAKDIALNDAGVAYDDAKRLKAVFEFDDGVAKYEVEFFANGYSLVFMCDNFGFFGLRMYDIGSQPFGYS